MNRNDEYLELKREMDELSAPGESVARAMARQQREKREKWGRFFLKPLGGLAAACALFVLLVNLSPAVAKACKGIPLLGDLAEAVRFYRSLSEAVEHEYYQKVNQQQTIDGVTVSVDYLIADKKGVTILYHICEAADLNLEDLELVPDLCLPEVDYTSECLRGTYGTEQSGGSFRIYFDEDQTPQSLPLKLDLYVEDKSIPQVSDPDVNPRIGTKPEPLSTFTFTLEVDQDFIVQGRHYEVDQIMEMDGQKIHITGIDIYPSFTSFTIEEEAGNTAWLTWLDYYLLTEDGTRYEPNSGLFAMSDEVGTMDYLAESVFFSSAEKLTLYVTGACWLSKDKDPETTQRFLRSWGYSQNDNSQYDVPIIVEFDLKK